MNVLFVVVKPSREQKRVILFEKMKNYTKLQSRLKQFICILIILVVQLRGRVFFFEVNEQPRMRCLCSILLEKRFLANLNLGIHQFSSMILSIKDSQNLYLKILFTINTVVIFFAFALLIITKCFCFFYGCSPNPRIIALLLVFTFDASVPSCVKPAEMSIQLA